MEDKNILELNKWRVECLRKALALIEHKADQALQGQYTKEMLLGVILKVSRDALIATE